MYYITTMHDNVEEVISVHPYDDFSKILRQLNSKYGHLNLSTTPKGSVKAVPSSNQDIYFTIVRINGENTEITDWRKNEDLLAIKDKYGRTIEFSSNYSSWNKSKNKEMALYIELYENNKSIDIGFGLEDMIKLRDYLNQKIEFLSE